MLHPFVQIWSTLAQKPRWQWVKCQTRGLNSVLHAATLYKKTSCSVLLFYLASCIFTYAWIKIPKMKEITPGVTVLLYFQFTTHFPSVGYDDLCLALCSVQSAAPRLLVFLKDWQTEVLWCKFQTFCKRKKKVQFLIESLRGKGERGL